MHYFFAGKILGKWPTSSATTAMSGNSNRRKLFLCLLGLLGAGFRFVEQPPLAHILRAPPICLASEKPVFEKLYLFFQNGDCFLLGFQSVLLGDDSATQFFNVV